MQSAARFRIQIAIHSRQNHGWNRTAQQSPMKTLMKVMKPKKSLGFLNGEDRI
jgi:hypothetical protein